MILLGIFTYLRLVQTLVEDLLYTIASLRIREFFVRLDPGVATALAVRGSADVPVPVAVITGALVALGLAATFLLHEERRLQRAMAEVPGLFEWGDSGMPEWAAAMGGHSPTDDVRG